MEPILQAGARERQGKRAGWSLGTRSMPKHHEKCCRQRQHSHAPERLPEEGATPWRAASLDLHHRKRSGRHFSAARNCDGGRKK
jgi:hypothetical protein